MQAIASFMLTFSPRVIDFRNHVSSRYSSFSSSSLTLLSVRLNPFFCLSVLFDNKPPFCSMTEISMLQDPTSMESRRRDSCWGRETATSAAASMSWRRLARATLTRYCDSAQMRVALIALRSFWSQSLPCVYIRWEFKVSDYGVYFEISNIFIYSFRTGAVSANPCAHFWLRN